MDGFAVRAQDTAGASYDTPIVLSVIGERRPGIGPSFTVGPGQAVRIMTGAPAPDGADAVVRFEETGEFSSQANTPASERVINIYREATPWQNLREAGEDVMPGQTVLTCGTRLGPAEIGLLAALNRDRVRVHPRPVVGILSTGDEVVDLGPDLQPGEIRNSNSYMLAALVAQLGGIPQMLGVARDDVDHLRAKLRDANDVDLLISSGGVSVGDYDMVKRVLQSDGDIELWQVRIKPGKPMAFGHIGAVPLLGLPGNPVAAYVAFMAFGTAIIRRMMGRPTSTAPLQRARLSESHENRGLRRHFVRGFCQRVDGALVVRPVEAQGSGVLTSLTRANCLFVIPDTSEEARAGMDVDVIPLREDWLN
jgi:molybdopterin molybdotransferase